MTAVTENEKLMKEHEALHASQVQEFEDRIDRLQKELEAVKSSHAVSTENMKSHMTSMALQSKALVDNAFERMQRLQERSEAIKKENEKTIAVQSSEIEKLREEKKILEATFLERIAFLENELATTKETHAREVVTMTDEMGLAALNYTQELQEKTEEQKMEIQKLSITHSLEIESFQAKENYVSELNSQRHQHQMEVASLLEEIASNEKEIEKAKVTHAKEVASMKAQTASAFDRIHGLRERSENLFEAMAAERLLATEAATAHETELAKLRDEIKAAAAIHSAAIKIKEKELVSEKEKSHEEATKYAAELEKLQKELSDTVKAKECIDQERQKAQDELVVCSEELAKVEAKHLKEIETKDKLHASRLKTLRLAKLQIVEILSELEEKDDALELERKKSQEAAVAHTVELKRLQQERFAAKKAGKSQ